MYIKYELDYEDGVDPTDPLGRLVISDDSENILSLNETYIDVWLVALLRAVLDIKESESLNVEVLEEPYSLYIEENDSNIIIKYEKQSVKCDRNDMIIGIKNVSNDFIRELSKYEGFDKNEAIKLLKKLIN